MKNTLLKIMAWSAVALIVPALGNWFVEGWNWGWNDFLFAWVFWVIMASTILFLTGQFSNHKRIVGILTFIVFASIWILLATG